LRRGEERRERGLDGASRRACRIEHHDGHRLALDEAHEGDRDIVVVLRRSHEGKEIEVLVGERMRELVRKDRTLLRGVEALAAAEDAIPNAAWLLLRFLGDEVERLRIGIVE